MMLKNGLLISFEGLDGCGKSTQIEMLKKSLGSMPVTVVAEPGNTSVSNKIKSILKDPSNKLCAETELFLFQASRAQLVSEVIRPKLKQGEIVITDRFFDSTWAYQGWARGVNLLAIELTNKLATHGVEVDKTFLLDIPVSLAVERIKLRGVKPDRFEQEGVTLLKKVHEGYKELARTYPNRIEVIDATKPIDQVQKEIQMKINKLITLNIQ